MYHVTDVAEATERTVGAVRRALEQGRLPRADATKGTIGSSRRTRYIRATPADLARWSRGSLEEALAAYPNLPQKTEEWITQAGLASALGVTSWEAHRILRQSGAFRLKWGGPPFRPDIAYHIPDIDEVHRMMVQGEVLAREPFA